MTRTQPVQWHPVSSIEAVRAWRPDPTCIAAGDEHVLLAVRCFAAGGLSDAAITRRLRQTATELEPLGFGRYDAVLALARHGAVTDAPATEIVGWLAQLALQVPCWPDDPEELASITRTALQEAGR